MEKNKYKCECCNYNTNNITNYNKHESTLKHKNNVNKVIIEKLFCCSICNKKYKSNVGLWKHKQTCIVLTPPNVHQNTQQSITPEINDKMICEYIENNKEIFLSLLLNIKDNNQLVSYKPNNELVKFDENNLKNEVIQVKEEVMKVEKKLNQRIDKLEERLNYYTDNFCENNIDYELFVSDLPITHKFCKELSEDFFQLITGMLKKEIKKYGIENSPIYCMVNSKNQIVVKVKMNKIWNTYYHNDTRILTAIKEIIEPIIERIKKGIEEYPDEKIKNKNGFITHTNMLEDKTQQVGIMRYGLYEPIELNVRKIKKLTEKKQGLCKEDNDEDEDDYNP